jgi:hypothetical protein
MRPLTNRETRTVRLGAAVIVIYLAGFGGWQGWKSFAKKRADYQQLVKQSQALRREIQPYETKVLLVKKLMERYRLDPARLNRATVVAEANAAIQKAAMAGGVQVGAIREEYAHGSAKELATIKIEGSGPVSAVTAFLYRLEGLGYPLIIDAVQIGSDPARSPGPPGPGGPSGPMGPRGPMPGMGPMGSMGSMGPPGVVKLSLTVVILNFDLWKNEGVPNA